MGFINVDKLLHGIYGEHVILHIGLRIIICFSILSKWHKILLNVPFCEDKVHHSMYV